MNGAIAAAPAEDMRDAITAAYWRELESRYSVANVRRFFGPEQLSDEAINRLRNFFLDRVYPPAERRLARDLAFQNLGSVLKSPRKLLPLMGGTIVSVFKLGRMIGDAFKAAYHTLEAYVESERLESEMARLAAEQNRQPDDLKQRAVIAALVRAIPEPRVRKFQREILALFNALANVALLRSTLDILDRSRDVMAAHPELYSEPERAGLEYGRAVLQGGYELFVSLAEGQDRLVLDGIRLIEDDWYDEIRRLR